MDNWKKGILGRELSAEALRNTGCVLWSVVQLGRE